jgi:hypothetical protein
VDPSQFHGPKDYLDAARDPAASVEDLRALAESQYVFVVIAVAEHPSAPIDVLEQLIPREPHTWNDVRMLDALAKNPRTPPAILAEIASLIPALLHRRDLDAFAVGLALFERGDTPRVVLEQLLADERTTTQFRKVVARDSTRDDILELLRRDRSERVRRAADRRTIDPSP